MNKNNNIYIYTFFIHGITQSGTVEFGQVLHAVFRALESM